MTRYSMTRGLLYTAPPETDRRTDDNEPSATADPAAPTAAPADD